MKTKLIFNPYSGIRKNNENLLGQIAALLQADGCIAEIGLTSVEEPGIGLAREAVAEGFELIIAAGGDGTISQVAGAVVDTSVTLGIIPMGTANNIAKGMGIPVTVKEACQVITRGKTQAVDVGKTGDFYFFEAAGVGLDAELAEAIEKLEATGLPGLGAALPDLVGAFGTAFSYQRPAMRLVLDDQAPVVCESYLVTISTGPYYGQTFTIAPNASITDGKLDVAVFEGMSKLELLTHFLAITNGRRSEHAKITRYQAARVEVSSTEPLHVHADGHDVGEVPVTFEAIPLALRLKLPSPSPAEE